MGREASSRSARPVWLGALALLVAVGMSGRAVAFPGLPPGVPTPPHVKLPKPDQTAAFDLVVEGEATDKLVSSMSGTSGDCLVTEDGTVDSTAKYLRGRGVAVEFDRYGKTIIIHRKGRKTDISLAVQVEEKRTATGGTNYAPVVPGAPCSVPPFNFADNPHCGQTFKESGAMELTYELPGKLGLKVTRKTALGGGTGKENSCGEAPETGINEPFVFTWPNQPPLEPSLHETPKKIFGHKHVIVVRLRSHELGKRNESHQKFGLPPLTGEYHETAFNEATVRLIRRK